MAITAFHYKKITAENNTAPKNKVTVNNKTILTDVKEAKLSIGNSKQKAIEFSFDYSSVYEPEAGSILIQGALLYVGSDTKVKETMEMWKKEKKLPPDVLQEVYNPILEKCSIEALLLSKEMLLPPQIPLPKMTMDKVAGKEQKK
jgi:hypothetical protein